MRDTAPVREITMNEGRIASEVRGEEDPESVYEKYFHHEEPAKSCPGTVSWP